MEVIEVNNIVKQYGNHLAVDHLSFHVEKGQIYGFLGPNGAGKSTTMNIITGYLAAEEGTVKINGVDLLEQPEEAKKCIGYLPEIPPLYVDMTVCEYLRFVAELKKVPKADRKNALEDVLVKTHLESVKDRLIKNLSKGYKQRVGLAQALLGNPEILILDEPTVGLDPKQIIEIRELVKELAKEHTIILSSHILSEVSALCDKIMIISHGKLVACDTPQNLSESVTGKTTLRLQIKNQDNRVPNLLETHFGNRVILKQDLESPAEQAIWSGTIEMEGNMDIREELFYLLAEEKCPLLQLVPTRMSLEDIFLELTDEEVKDSFDGDENVQNSEESENQEEQKEEEVAHESDL